MSLSERWIGRHNTTLNASDIRSLKDHLFAGDVALIVNGIEYLAALAPGVRQPNTTKTGVTLTVQIKRCSSSILRDSVNRPNGVFISRVPYMHKTLLTCNISTLVSISESFGEVYQSRLAYPVRLSSSFTSWVSADLEVSCAMLSLGCRVTTGFVAPLAGLVWKVPIPAIVFSMVMVTAAVAFAIEFPFRDVANFVMPVAVYAWDSLMSLGQAG